MASSSVSREKIEQRAYEIFESRGGKHGNDLDDWLMAERELSLFTSKSSTISFKQKKNAISNNKLRYGY